MEKLRGERVVELKSDEGWLTVAGLFWLKAGDNTAGSASSNALVLPKAAPAQLGVFTLADGRVTFKAAPGTAVTTNGQPVTTTVLDARAGEKGALSIGDLRLFLIRRGDKYGIRMRDLRSRMRQSFTGLTYYPISEPLRVKAQYVPYETPHTIPIPNVLGQTPEMVSPGYVTFTIGGRALRLEPVYETDDKKDLFFIFKDPTSRDSTYPAGRFLHAPLPVDGTVTLDFNLAYNPPCAFTDFATCPLPPKQNQLAVRIEAGRKRTTGRRAERTEGTRRRARVRINTKARRRRGRTEFRLSNGQPPPHRRRAPAEVGSALPFSIVANEPLTRCFSVRSPFLRVGAVPRPPSPPSGPPSPPRPRIHARDRHVGRQARGDGVELVLHAGNHRQERPVRTHERALAGRVEQVVLAAAAAALARRVADI